RQLVGDNDFQCGYSIIRGFWSTSSESETNQRARRPAVVQSAKTFELQRNNTVNRIPFPQTFPQLSRKYSVSSRKADLKSAIMPNFTSLQPPTSGTPISRRSGQ